MALSEESRAKLDEIVKQMTTNGESDSYIQSVVNDFKTKYDNGKIADLAAPHPWGTTPPAADDNSLSANFSRGVTESVNKHGSAIADLWKGMWHGKKVDPVSAAIQTVGNVAGIGVDTIGHAIGGIASAVTPDFIENPIKEQFAKSIAESNIPQILEKYKGWAANHPTASADLEGIINIASILPTEKAVGMGIEAASKYAGREGVTAAAEAAAKTTAGDVLTAAADATPTVVKDAAAKVVGAAGRATDLAGDVVKSGVSHFTGISPKDITTIIDNPEAFTASEMKNISRGSLTERVAKTLDDRITALDDLGGAYDDVRALPNKVRMTWEKGIASPIHEVLAKYGLEVGRDGKLLQLGKSAKDLTGGDISALERFIKQYGTAGDLTAEQFLNLRSGLATMAKYDLADPKKWASDIARDLRAKYNDIGRPQLPGLAALDAKYAPEVESLNYYRKEFFDKATGAFDFDKATRKIANATGKNKDEFLADLEKLQPGITEDINIVKAIEGVELAKGQKVATYFREGARLAAGTGVLTMNPAIAVPSMIAMILTHPGVAVGLIRQFGRLKGMAKNIINNIIVKMRGGRALDVAESKIFKDAVAEYSDKADQVVAASQNELKQAGTDVVTPELSQTPQGAPQAAQLANGTPGAPLDPVDPTVPKVQAPEQGAKFEQAKGLTPQDRKVEDAAFKRISGGEDALLSKYDATEGLGKVVNTDNFRPFFKEDGYVGSNAAAVQEPASYLAKKAFTNNLKKPGKYATFFAGGSGTGKTSAVKALLADNPIYRDSSVILDGNLSSYSGAVRKITEAVNAGKKVPIVYVYRDPVESFTKGVVDRMLRNESEMGRLVPSKVIAGNHIDSWDVIKRFHDEGADITFIDNSLGQGKARLSSFEDLSAKINYPSEAELTSQFNKEAKQLYEQGKITKAQYEGYIR